MGLQGRDPAETYEKKILDNELKYRRLVENALEGIWAIDAEYRTSFVNDNVAKMLGYAKEEIVGRSILDFMDGKGEDIIVCDMIGLHPGSIKEREVDLLRKDGPRLHARMTVSPIISNEAFEGSVVFISDISEGKRAEEELLTNQLKMAAGMELAHLGYWECDIQSNTFHFNDGFYTLYGTDAKRSGGYDMSYEDYIRNFVHPDDAGHVMSETQKNREAEYPTGHAQYQHRIIDGKGEVRYVIARVGAIKDISGHVVRIYGVNQDVTELKTAEESLRRTNEKLNLLNNITRHDINNQLMFLGGAIEIVKKNETNLASLALLTKSTDSIRNIYAQIDFTKQYQEMGTASPIWHDLMRTVLSQPEMRDVEIELAEGMKGLEVYADPMFGKVFHNLLENSIKYGGHELHVRIDCRTIDDILCITYKDNGPGISDEDRKNMFQKGHGRGTGMGMFLSREILGITGITIKETGQLGEGIRFEMLVPKGYFKHL